LFAEAVAGLLALLPPAFCLQGYAMKRSSLLLAILLCFPVIGLTGQKANKAPGGQTLPPPSGKKLALLVGCTKYDKLTKGFQLVGPGNDVVLLRQTLKDRFGFKDGDMVTLAEGPNAAGRPTRANIKEEFDRLAKIAGPGDQIVILLGGHGSQQPDQPPYDETDGLDETFLPCDAGPWDGGKETVTNAIIDDELGVWTKAITDRRAFLWLIVDACHSGTMLRGGGADEVAREVPANELIPEAVLEKARKDASTRKLEAEDAPFAGTGPFLVGLYAAQPYEPTVERFMPPDTGTTKYGLLTYTLCQILTQANAPLTYRDVCQRIHTQYVTWGRTSPTPLTEGPGLDTEVLGVRTFPGQKLVLAREGEEEGTWKIKAGLLHGLTSGSILAVHPPAGQADKLLGHVCVTKCTATEAEVKACPHAKLPEQKELPLGGRCVPVFVDFGDLRLRVALDAEANKSADGPRLRKELEQAARDPDSPVSLTDDPGKADVLALLKNGKAYLVAADVAKFPEGKVPAGAPRFGPYPLDRSDKLHKALARIARARNLLRLAGAGSGQDSGGLGLEVTMLKTEGKQDRKGKKLTWEKDGLRLTEGEWVAWQLVNKNKNREAVYFTLLFIDSNYGIHAFFPKPGTVAENLLKVGETQIIGPIRVNAKTVGLEHVAVIAVRASGEPVDFTCLAQPTLERAGEAASRGKGGKQAMESPLGKVLQKALYARGKARGFDSEDMETSELRLLSWQVLPATPKR
jgi:hypothetical protein